MKKHNFNPGPSILPQFTLEKTAEAILDLDATGISVMSISHRSKEFTEIIQGAKSLINELLDIPGGYSILFLGGGASLQFSMIPYNLLNRKAAYLNTGSWASKAIKEAGIFGEVVVVASSEDKNFNYIPTGFSIPPDSDYFHITTNNTIYGTEIKSDPDSPVPLVADMSSDIFSRPVDVSKYGLIYAGAQKNLGPAGVTLVIVREDILGRVERPIPSMLNYKLHVEKESLYNTPPVLAIYASLQTLIWLKNQGGLSAMHKINQDKARLLYDEIGRNRLFKCTVDNHDDRSIMNICFVMHEEYKELENSFIEFASSKGITGIKGHRSVGGFRASLYNALPRDSVVALVETMKEFEKSV